MFDINSMLISLSLSLSLSLMVSLSTTITFYSNRNIYMFMDFTIVNYAIFFLHIIHDDIA